MLFQFHTQLQSAPTLVGISAEIALRREAEGKGESLESVTSLWQHEKFQGRALMTYTWNNSHFMIFWFSSLCLFVFPRLINIRKIN